MKLALGQGSHEKRDQSRSSDEADKASVVEKDVAKEKVRQDPEASLQGPKVVTLRRLGQSFNSSSQSHYGAQLT